MATIGVTRGFGDHDLKVHGTDISIKPFLSCSPEVVSFFLKLQSIHRVHQICIKSFKGYKMNVMHISCSFPPVAQFDFYLPGCQNYVLDNNEIILM